LIVPGKVSIIAGFFLAPESFAAAPVLTETKTPAVVYSWGNNHLPGRTAMTHRLDHIGIAVKNLGDGFAFYGRVVALGEPTIKEIPFAAPSLIRAPA
jgi:hypothetical protein